jgi:hypothetical protein
MKKTFKYLCILVALVFSCSIAFAGDLTYTSFASKGAIQVQAIVTKYPALTATAQMLSYNSNSTQTINIPPFALPPTYYVLTSLTFFWNGGTVTFSGSELSGTGTLIKHFGSPVEGCAIFLARDGNGNYSASIDCLVGG